MSTGYDLTLFTVLVVDDNTYMRNLLRAVLARLGVGNVLVASDGGDAIEILKRVKTDPMKAGASTVDIVMANWQMSPVDGMMLLKWIRRHADSPDRFMPFVLVTGYADPAKVREARDLGVNEILAKPYTVQALIDRLGVVIERPRQFVLTPRYFGPDRRRRKVDPAAERREKTDKDVDIIYDQPKR